MRIRLAGPLNSRSPYILMASVSCALKNRNSVFAVGRGWRTDVQNLHWLPLRV